MEVTDAMVAAARLAEHDQFQRTRGKVGLSRFVPTPDETIRIMLEAVLKDIEAAEKAKVIVTARKPRPKRR